jgi:imidazolonepropionase-like amidohydrolase
MVYEGARLIVGDLTPAIENSAFVVENGRFTQVGRLGQVKVPAGAGHVDLTGKTVMPAILDVHTHSVQASTTRAQLVERLEQQAYFGVAAVLSLRDPGEVPFEVRANLPAGAALFHTGGRGMIGPEGGAARVEYQVSTEDEARQAVQDHAALHVDMIKIWVDDRHGQVPALPAVAYRAIIDEANKYGLRVYAHIRYLRDAKELLRAGLHGFAHTVRDIDIDEELVALWKQRPEVFLTPNLPPRGVAPDLTWLQEAFPAETYRKILDQAENGGDGDTLRFNRQRPLEPFAIQARNLARLNAAGVKIGLGTDSSVGWGVHVEMEDMVQAGMTPAQVLVAATSASADILKLADYGIVAAGKSASFIVLNANPLDDITNTRRIVAVYLRGAAVNRTAMRARWSRGAS